jgi:hypothetical protein
MIYWSIQSQSPPNFELKDLIVAQTEIQKPKETCVGSENVLSRNLYMQDTNVKKGKMYLGV